MAQLFLDSAHTCTYMVHSYLHGSLMSLCVLVCADDTNIGSLGDMLEESLKMRSFDHPNVLGLIGVCLELGPAPYIITKYMSNGSLLNFLKKERHSLTVTMSTTNPELVQNQLSAMYVVYHNFIF